MISRMIMQRYAKPRSKFEMVIASVFVSPALIACRRDLKALEKQLNAKTLELGRLEMTAKLIQQEWKK